MHPGPRFVVLFHVEMTIMCRVVSTALPSSTGSPREARAWTETWLRSWDVDDHGVTTLLVSELVTNAVQYTHGTATVTLAVAAGMIEVAVSDSGSVLQVVRAQRDIDVPGGGRILSERGRGLVIVQALTEDWGVSADGIGKQVWFRRPVAADWSYTATCVCRTDNPAAHRLPSGRAAVAVPGPWDQQAS
jgi:anti-sigma regulatory factor (Ser/Thr protein kinase)